ncbi:hypothetical protein HDU96_003595, partial [Phlyctochytrium bullatum]
LPIPIKLKQHTAQKDVDRALRSTYLHFVKGGVSSAIKVGRSSQSVDEVVKNVITVAKNILGTSPLSKYEIQSLAIKIDRSPTLPLDLVDGLLEPEETLDDEADTEKKRAVGKKRKEGKLKPSKK